MLKCEGSFNEAISVSDIEYDSYILEVLKNRKLLDGDEVQKHCEQIIEKSQHRDLFIGEILLLVAAKKWQESEKFYFSVIWSPAKILKPFLEMRIWEITDEMVENKLPEDTVNRKQNIAFAMFWVRWSRKTEYNTPKPYPDYGIHTKPCRKSSSIPQKYHDEIYFPPEYSLPRYAKFSTVYKYWIWKNKSEYSDTYINVTMYGAFMRLKPLHNIPFWKIRPEEVQHCMLPYPNHYRNRMVSLYRTLDRFAYMNDIVSCCRSEQLHHIKLFSTIRNSFNQNDIEELYRHNGEIDVDMTLVLLYTRLIALEVCALQPQDIGAQSIRVSGDRSHYSTHELPIHPRIVNSLGHVMGFLLGRDGAMYRSEEDSMAYIGWSGMLQPDIAATSLLQWIVGYRS